MFFMKYEQSDLPDLPRWIRRLLRWSKRSMLLEEVPLLPRYASPQDTIRKHKYD